MKLFSDVKCSDLQHSDVRRSDVKCSDVRHSDVARSDVPHSDVRRSQVRDAHGRRRSWLKTAVLIVLLLTGGFLAFSSMNAEKLSRLDPDEMGLPVTDQGDSFADRFVVFRGTIKETLSLQTTIPANTYRVREKSFPSFSDEKLLFAGQVIPSDTSNFLDLSEVDQFLKCRILSVDSGETSSKQKITYLRSQTVPLSFFFPKQYRNLIHAASPIRLSVEEEEIDSADVRITGFSPAIKDGKGLLLVSFFDRDIIGRDGCSVTADITVQEKKDVLLLPSQCVYTDENGSSFVFAEGDTDLAYVPVETGITDGTYVEIRSGVKEGDTVVLL